MRFIEDMLTSASAMRGTPTGIDYVTDLTFHRTFARFNANTDSILYDWTYWPKEGTAGFWLAATGSGTIVADSNQATYDANTGHIRLTRTNDAKLVFGIHDSTGISEITSHTTLSVSAYYWVAISWGNQGIRLWIDGSLDNGIYGFGVGSRGNFNVCLGNYSGTEGFTGFISQLWVSDVQNDPLIVRGDDGAMALRVHSYGVAPSYDFDFQYRRNRMWRSLKTRVRSDIPIVVTKEHQQLYTGEVVLDNTDGLLSLNNRTSAYNLNLGSYEALLDEARPVRILQGIDCYSNISQRIVPTASAVPRTNHVESLTDRLYGDPTDATDKNWVKWTIAANGHLTLTIDFGATKKVVCGCLSFASLTSAVVPLVLPATVLFEYSYNGVDYTQCAPAFDMSEYTDTAVGERYLAWFADLDISTRYVRATINAPADESVTVAIDEFCVYGGRASLVTKETLNGFLGDSIDSDTAAGTITVRFLDVRKREDDLRQVELTSKYLNQRPEQIIYDLLTNVKYWTGSQVNADYNAPLRAAEIGWESTDNLSGFIIPSWQGQSKTILGYIDELAQLIGWVFDCDGDGKRQFWEPEYSRDIASTYCNYFGDRWGIRGTPRRHRTGEEIRNDIWVSGKQAPIGTNVGVRVTHEGSIAKYGPRYARINEPLATTPELQKKLGEALIRDFAYARDGLSLDARGDFDLDRPKKIMTFHEDVRENLDLGELWSLESLSTQMVTDGDGDFRATLVSRYYVGGPVSAVSNLVATSGMSGQMLLVWDAPPEANVDGYYVYYSVNNGDPADWSFTKRAKVTDPTDTVTGLTNGQSYAFYVRAVNRDGAEGPRCVPAVHAPSLSVLDVATADQWRVDFNWSLPALSYRPGVTSVILTFETAHLTWPVLPEWAIIALLGPSTSVSPTNVSEQIILAPTAKDGNEECNRRHPITAFASGATVRVLPKLYRIMISGVLYEFGTPVTGTGYACNWPTY